MALRRCEHWVRGGSSPIPRRCWSTAPATLPGAYAQTSPRYDLVPGQDMPTPGNLGSTNDSSLIRAHYSSVSEGHVRDKGTEFHFDGEYRAADQGLLKSVLFGTA